MKKLIGGILISGAILSANLLHAQDAATLGQDGTITDTNIDWNSMSAFDVELKAVEAMPTISAADLAASGLEGTFYSAQHISDWPPVPGDWLSLPVWEVDTNLFLIDDLHYRYDTPQTQSATISSGMQALNESGGGFTPDFNISSNGLWLQITGVSNGFVNLILYGTTNGVEYEILSQPALGNGTPISGWNSEGIFLGSSVTNWTSMAIPQNGRTNLFFSARSWQSSDGSGLPDWWEILYFGHTGIDPLAPDPSGDGYDIWQSFEDGFDPDVFNSPPPPQQFQAVINNSSTVTLTWQSSPGMVIGYTIQRWDEMLLQQETFTVGVTNQFVDTNFIDYPPWDASLTYYVQANYTNGNSGWSEASPSLIDGSPAAQILLGSGGSTVLAVAEIPASASGLQISRIDYSEHYYDYLISGSNTFYLPISALTNGAYTIPTNMTGLGYDGSSWYVQTVWSNAVMNVASAATFAGYLEAQSEYSGYFIPGRFNDASTQMVQNATFLLRAAGLASPFTYSYDAGYGLTAVNQPTNYAYVGYWNVNENTGDGLGNASYLDWGLPFQENYRYRNFIFSSTNINSSGFLNTGCQSDYSLQSPITFTFASTNTTGLPGILSSSQTTYEVPYSSASALGINNSGGQFSLPNNIYNYYGLKLLSVMVAHVHSGTLHLDTLSAGGTLPSTNDIYYFYPQFDQPEFETVGYYFGRTENNYTVGTQNYNWLGDDPLPGNNDFSPTNAQPLLIGSVGTVLQVAAFSKQIILNGNTGIPVYIAQYFDKAYEVNTNGNVTTNQTGVLSPYGIFLPTEPGPAALVTLPDENGQRGTDIVQVVSLQLDANHDGNMDSSYYGQDYTTGYGSYDGNGDRVMSFWENDGHDEPGNGANLDQDLEVEPGTSGDANGQVLPNYDYQRITCQRDLENFARLWVSGLPDLPTNQNYTVTLSMDDASYGGAINLYQAYESDGGTSYLTDTNVAASQVSPPYGNSLAQLDYYWDYYTLPMDNNGKALITHFLFEGASDQTGLDGVVLTVSQNGQPIAQTTAYVNFSHVTDLYEQAAVTNVIQTWPEMVQQPETSGFQVLSTPPVYNSYETNQLAVFVHGWRMSSWDWEDFSDIMFKRLYWAGYQGRFASLRWPTRSTDTDTNIILGYAPSSYFTYNRSEHIAFESGTGAVAYFNDLRQRFPDDTISACSHSMGGIVMMEALKELVASGQAPLDNYVMMQAAVPAQCYDTSVTNFPPFEDEEELVPTPNTYSNYAAGITNALRSGKIINFFNTNDFALQQAWVLNQGFYLSSSDGPLTLKPNTFFGYSYDASTGVAQVTTNSWQLGVGVTNVETRVVTDPLELMPFVARPRSLAVGAEGGVRQMVSGQLDLATFGFGGAPYDHSGEFNRNIQTPQVQGFYTNLVINLFPSSH